MKFLYIIILIFNLIFAVYNDKFCATPNGELAKCISIHDCKIFVKAFSNQTYEIVQFMRDSKCGYTTVPLVCCGSDIKHDKTISGVTKNYSSHQNVQLLPEENECGKMVWVNWLDQNTHQLDEYSWVVLLEYRNHEMDVGYKCGGVLINKRYVLTAAHCVEDNPNRKVFRVQFSEYNLNTTFDCLNDECITETSNIEIEEIISHPNYKKEKFSYYNDIALLRLAVEVNYTDFASPICLPLHGKNTPYGKKLFTSGWGINESGTYSQIKAKENLPAIKNCAKIYKEQYNIDITDSQLCAGGITEKDSCVTDDGGAIVSIDNKFYLEGILSFGAKNCGTVSTPRVYTRISSYLDWILDNIRP